MAIVRSTLLSLGMVTGVAFPALAQTDNLASLPANPTAEPPAAASPVAPSPTYVGPTPGAGTGAVPRRFEKSADWDSNMALHPYTSGLGPKPH
jgi:hypothetical protein